MGRIFAWTAALVEPRAAAKMSLTAELHDTFMPEPTVLVQLSDPHVVEPGRLLQDRIDTPALLSQAVARVCRLQPAATAVLITGDLVDQGSAAEYGHLRTLLAPLPCPVHLMPGNHDHIPTLRQVFEGLATLQPAPDALGLGAHVLFSLDLPGLRVVALDTAVPGQEYGTLCEARLAWLERTLAAAPHQPTVVAMHHPPFATGIGYMDRMGLREGAQALEALLRRHPQVERLVCGHLHRSIQCRFGGTLAMTVPSTAHQIALDLRPRSPLAWRLEPPGFALHVMLERTLVTHIVASGEHGPEVPYA
jgi:3',5'-cyclic-AMP phosphodiesterase